MLPDIAGFVVTPSCARLGPPHPAAAEPAGRGADRRPPLVREEVPREHEARRLPHRRPRRPPRSGLEATTAKAAENSGWKIVYTDKYPAAGRCAAGRPYVQAMKDKGVRAIMWTGEPEGLAKLEQAMADANFSVDWIRTPPNHNDQNLIDIAGAGVEEHLRLELLRPVRGSQGLPGDAEVPRSVRASTSRTRRRRPTSGCSRGRPGCCSHRPRTECGSDLTRTCVYNTAKKIHDWTGGGLHATTDPGANSGVGASSCCSATPQGLRAASTSTRTTASTTAARRTRTSSRGKQRTRASRSPTSGKTMKDLK